MNGRMLASVRRMFDPKILASISGAPLGWHQHRGSTSHAPIALWFTTALALACNREDIFDEQEHSRIETTPRRVSGHL